MTKQSFVRRFLFPVGTIFLLWFISFIIYNTAWQWGINGLHKILAYIFGTIMFASIAFGAFFIYPVMFFKGALAWERILGCFFNPFIWATKECIRVSVSFTFFECLYYYLNPLNIWLICALLFEIGLSDTISRYIAKRKDPAIKVANIYSILAMIIGIGLVVFIFSQGQGEDAYVFFLENYRLLFGAGQGI